MADLAPLKYGFVKGRYLADVDDSGDSGVAPDSVPLKGSVTFTLSVPYYVVADAVPDPAVLFPQAITKTLDSDGYLNHQGSHLVPLRATNDDATNPTNLQWTATFNLETQDGVQVAYPPYRFALPAGTTVDLPTVQPLVIPAPNTIIIKGEDGAPGVDGAPGAPGAQGLPGLNGVPTDEATATYAKTAGTKLNAAVWITAARALGDVSIREWAESYNIYSNENGDNYNLFTQAMSDLSAAYFSSGMLSNLLVFGGRFGFGTRLTPPLASSTGLRGYFGIHGEGMYRTTFVTAATNSWMGINQQAFNDPDWAAEKMDFRRFTVDGSNQPVGSSYSSGLKGFIFHNIRETLFEAVRVYNTHATGFGVDYSQADFFDCIAEYCGRGRKTHSPDPTTRVGSGSGFGIGFGQKAQELIRIFRAIARFNGASGIFAEQLGQPEAFFKAIGMMVSGAVVNNNAIGLNDTGTKGSIYDTIWALNNKYTGVRIGVSNASEQGGVDGQYNNIVTAGNRFGVALEGSSEGPTLFNGLESYDNTEDGVIFRDGLAAWPAPDVRFRNAHIHHNGGHGVNAATSYPIVGLDFEGHVEGNAGDAFHFVAPLSDVRIDARTQMNKGWALNLQGVGETLELADINLRTRGSIGGGINNKRTPDSLSTIVEKGNPATVTQLVTQPKPLSTSVIGTDWIGTSATPSYQTSFVDESGVDIGAHMAFTATGSSPRGISTPFTVPDKGTFMAYARGVWPKGKSVQISARFGSGGTSVLVAGPIVRATGKIQEIHWPLTNRSGFTTARVGFTGAASAVNPWVSGDIGRLIETGATMGGQYWGPINGSMANCAWTGTPGNSTSVLTIPVPTTGFNLDFTAMIDGTVTPQATFVNAGTPIPLIVQSGRAKAGTGGSASRTLHVWDGQSPDGIFNFEIGEIADHLTGFVFHTLDAQNTMFLAWQRNGTTLEYKMTKRVANSESELTGLLTSVASNSNDTGQLIISGASVEVKINGATIFGGPIANAIPTELLAGRYYGWMLTATQVTRNESIKKLRFTPAT